LHHHRNDQRGVSGHQDRGAEAIVVAERRDDCPGQDYLEKLLYVVESSNGGGAMLKSAEKKWPVRVFRSSKLKNQYQAPKKDCSTGYRYDGVYRIHKTQFTNETVTIPQDKLDFMSDKTEKYFFHMERIPVGKDPIDSNRLSNQELRQCIRIDSEEELSLVEEVEHTTVEEDRQPPVVEEVGQPPVVEEERQPFLVEEVDLDQMRPQIPQVLTDANIFSAWADGKCWANTINPSCFELC